MVAEYESEWYKATFFTFHLKTFVNVTEFTIAVSLAKKRAPRRAPVRDTAHKPRGERFLGTVVLCRGGVLINRNHPQLAEHAGEIRLEKWGFSSMLAL